MHTVNMPVTNQLLPQVTATNDPALWQRILNAARLVGAENPNITARIEVEHFSQEYQLLAKRERMTERFKSPNESNASACREAARLSRRMLGNDLHGARTAN